MKKLHHSRWPIVGFSFATLALSYAVWYSFSVFFVALLKEFHWSHSLGAGAFSAFIAFHHVMGPFAGRMYYRFGPRSTILFGSLILGSGLFLSSFTRAWWQYYLFFGFITPAGLGMTGWITNATLIHSRFKEKRGLPMGIISSGIGIGILICVPSIQYLIDRVGWRTAYRLMAFLIPGIISLLACLFLRTPKESLTLPSSQEASPPIVEKTAAPNPVGTSKDWTVWQAIRTGPFWFLGLSFFLGSFTVQAALTHHVAFFVDRGIQALFASYVVGMVGIASIVGKILLGTLSDRIGREPSYSLGATCGILAMVSLIAFNYRPSPLLCYPYALFIGIGYSATAVLPPIMTSDFFGGKTYGQIFGTLFMWGGMGAASGAWAAGFVHDLFGGYLPIFIIGIIFFVAAAGFVWRAAPRKALRIAATQ